MNTEEREMNGMRTLILVILTFILTSGLLFAEGGQNQGITGTGTTSTGTSSQGTSSQPRSGR
jgi:hypothetical protein